MDFIGKRPRFNPKCNLLYIYILIAFIVDAAKPYGMVRRISARRRWPIRRHQRE
jgi:hypothetical protein